MFCRRELYSWCLNASAVCVVFITLMTSSASIMFPLLKVISLGLNVTWILCFLISIKKKNVLYISAVTSFCCFVRIDETRAMKPGPAVRSRLFMSCDVQQPPRAKSHSFGDVVAEIMV